MAAIKLLRQSVIDLFNYLLPPACALCLARLEPPDPDHFCSVCTEQIPELGKARCPHCALPYPAPENPAHLCKTCLTEKRPLFSGVTAIGRYDGLLREAVHRLKYRGDINLDRPLANLLVRRLRQDKVRATIAIPVPLHASKTRQRGYNQSALLATRIGRRLDIPVATDLLARHRPGLPQQQLAAADRIDNIKGAFALRRPVDGEDILLIDDVMTTGATARECARVLGAGGAASVHLAILARAPLK
ncbi:MAG: amidophosphoribosyltransferase [Desulfuromonas sp.]|nr:MAG: amidophosphoribosyltransferase [Desulfuromonas sp.]